MLLELERGQTYNSLVSKDIWNARFWADPKGENKTYTHSRAQYEYDLSTISGNYFIGVCKASDSDGGWGRYDIYNFYLEP